MNYPKTDADGTIWIRVQARCPFHKAHGDHATTSPNKRGPRHEVVTDPDLKCMVPSCTRIRAYLYARADGTVVRHPCCTPHRSQPNWRTLLPVDLRVPQRKHLVRVPRKKKPAAPMTMDDVVVSFCEAKDMLPLDRTDLITWYDRWRQDIYTLDQIITFWERPNRASLSSQPRMHFRDTAQLKELFDWFETHYDEACLLAKIQR